MVSLSKKYVTIQLVVLEKLKKILVRDIPLAEFKARTKDGKVFTCNAWRKTAQACKGLVVKDAELLTRGYWDESDIYGSKFIITGIQKTGGKLTREEILVQEFGSIEEAKKSLEQKIEMEKSKGFLPVYEKKRDKFVLCFLKKDQIVKVEGINVRKSEWFCDVLGADKVTKICMEELGADVTKMTGVSFVTRQKKLWKDLTRICLDNETRFVEVYED